MVEKLQSLPKTSIPERPGTGPSPLENLIGFLITSPPVSPSPSKERGKK